MIIWLTGPSGAGKTTLAKEMCKYINSIILDGDEMRESISLGLGFSRKDRSENNMRIARLANVLNRQTSIIVSVIAPIEKTRREIDDLCSPIWVYVKRTLPERKGHFYEEPHSYFTVDHDNLSIIQSAQIVLAHSSIMGNWH